MSDPPGKIQAMEPKGEPGSKKEALAVLREAVWALVWTDATREEVEASFREAFDAASNEPWWTLEDNYPSHDEADA